MKGLTWLLMATFFLVTHSTLVVEPFDDPVYKLLCLHANNVTYYPHMTNCNSFIKCTNNEPFETICSPNLIWNQNKHACDYAETTDCLLFGDYENFMLELKRLQSEAASEMTELNTELRNTFNSTVTTTTTSLDELNNSSNDLFDPATTNTITTKKKTIIIKTNLTSNGSNTDGSNVSGTSENINTNQIVNNASLLSQIDALKSNPQLPSIIFVQPTYQLPSLAQSSHVAIPAEAPVLPSVPAPLSPRQRMTNIFYKPHVSISYQGQSRSKMTNTSTGEIQETGINGESNLNILSNATTTTTSNTTTTIEHKHEFNETNPTSNITQGGLSTGYSEYIIEPKMKLLIPQGQSNILPNGMMELAATKQLRDLIKIIGIEDDRDNEDQGNFEWNEQISRFIKKSENILNPVSIRKMLKRLLKDSLKDIKRETINQQKAISYKKNMLDMYLKQILSMIEDNSKIQVPQPPPTHHVTDITSKNITVAYNITSNEINKGKKQVPNVPSELSDSTNNQVVLLQQSLNSLMQQNQLLATLLQNYSIIGDVVGVKNQKQIKTKGKREHEHQISGVQTNSSYVTSKKTVVVVRDEEPNSPSEWYVKYTPPTPKSYYIKGAVNILTEDRDEGSSEQIDSSDVNSEETIIVVTPPTPKSYDVSDNDLTILTEKGNAALLNSKIYANVKNQPKGIPILIVENPPAENVLSKNHDLSHFWKIVSQKKRQEILADKQKQKKKIIRVRPENEGHRRGQVALALSLAKNGGAKTFNENSGTFESETKFRHKNQNLYNRFIKYTSPSIDDLKTEHDDSLMDNKYNLVHKHEVNVIYKNQTELLPAAASKGGDQNLIDQQYGRIAIVPYISNDEKHRVVYEDKNKFTSDYEPEIEYADMTPSFYDENGNLKVLINEGGSENKKYGRKLQKHYIKYKTGYEDYPENYSDLSDINENLISDQLYDYVDNPLELEAYRASNKKLGGVLEKHEVNVAYKNQTTLLPEDLEYQMSYKQKYPYLSKNVDMKTLLKSLPLYLPTVAQSGYSVREESPSINPTEEQQLRYVKRKLKRRSKRIHEYSQ